MLDLYVFQNIVFWALVSYQAQAVNNLYWIDPASCIGNLDATIDDVKHWAQSAYIRMQPESDDDNQRLIFNTLWSDPPPSSDPNFNLNIVNSKSYKGHAAKETDLVQMSMHALPTFDHSLEEYH